MQFLQEFLEACLDLLGLELLQLQHRLDVLRHVELAEHRHFLWQVGQAKLRALVDGHVGERFAVDADVAVVGADETHDHVEAGRLARGVGTEQPYHLTADDLERHVLDHRARFVALAQPAHLQGAHCAPFRILRTVPGENPRLCRKRACFAYSAASRGAWWNFLRQILRARSEEHTSCPPSAASMTSSATPRARSSWRSFSWPK